MLSGSRFIVFLAIDLHIYSSFSVQYYAGTFLIISEIFESLDQPKSLSFRSKISSMPGDYFFKFWEAQFDPNSYPVCLAIRRGEGPRLSTDVERYLEKQKSPQKEIVERLRSIVLKTLPGIEEKLWMGVPWYDGRFYVVALKDHVNMGFSVIGLTDQEKSFFEGKGHMMRHIKFHSLDEIDENKIGKLLKLVSQKSIKC